jgi:hypothetical protein
MPQPTQSDVHVNRPLTNISVAYLQDLNEFVADKVFPNVPVMKQSDRYFLYEKQQWFRTDAQKRGVGQESAGSGFEIDNTPNYFCDVYALHKDIDDQIRANADAPINMDADATEFVTRGLALRKEKDWASTYFTTGIWTGSSTGTDIVPSTKWDASGSTPIKDIRAQMAAMKAKTGFYPNILLLAEDVWLALQDNADFLDRIAITQRKIVTLDLLASVLGIDRVLSASAVEDSANEGATASMNFLFTDDAALYYAQPRPSLMKPSAGYIFSWTGYLGASAMGNRIKRLRNDLTSCDRIEGEMAYDMKLVASDLGAFFDGCLT